MNKKQLKILWIGITIIVLMGLFPPWHTQIPQIGTQKPFGYAFIFAPPEVGSRMYPTLNIPQLMVQWIIVLAITGGLIVTFKDKRQKDE